jgi:hypothetical protein
MRVFRSPAFWVVLLSSCIAVVANVHERSGFGGRNSTLADDRPSLAKMGEITVLRESTGVSELRGRFRKLGERYLFEEDANANTAAKRPFKCLENSCLQRVVAAMQNEDRKQVWLVTARVTEFNDENFLLLEKAVRTR